MQSSLKQKMMMTPIAVPEQLNEESVLSTMLLQDLPDDILFTIFKHLNSGPDFVKLSINHPKFKRVIEEMMDHSDFEDFPIHWIDHCSVAPSGRSYSQFHIGYIATKPFNFPGQKVFPLDAYAVKLSWRLDGAHCNFLMLSQVKYVDISASCSVTDSDLVHLKNAHTLFAGSCDNLTNISGLRGGKIKKLSLHYCHNLSDVSVLSTLTELK